MVNQAQPAARRQTRNPRAAAPNAPRVPAVAPLRHRGRPGVVPGTERAVYEDETGRRWTVLVPAGHPEEAERGMVLGPPDLAGLALPEAQAVRLHNELQARGLLTAADLKGREREVFAALQAAFQVDSAAVLAAYRTA